jgi:hypothetical protein
LLLLHRSGLSPHTPCQSPGALTRVAACTLARSPYVVTAIRRLQTLRLLHVCSGRFRLERSPGGACTHWKSAALSRRTWECWTLETAAHLISKRLLEVISNRAAGNVGSPGNPLFPDFQGHFHGHDGGPGGLDVADASLGIGRTSWRGACRRPSSDRANAVASHRSSTIPNTGLADRGRPFPLRTKNCQQSPKNNQRIDCPATGKSTLTVKAPYKSAANLTSVSLRVHVHPG